MDRVKHKLDKSCGNIHKLVHFLLTAFKHCLGSFGSREKDDPAPWQKFLDSQPRRADTPQVKFLRRCFMTP
jgi:hypothetical protein